MSRARSRCRADTALAVARRWGPALGCALLLWLASAPKARAQEQDPAYQDPARWVDPFIGTGGHGHTFPGATLPFGMVQLSPDTRLEGWDGCSGYHYSDSVVYGFSHTHLSGTGVADYCDVLLMPTVGEPRFDNGYPDRTDEGYASRFEKATEDAEPGWYAVRLEDYGIDVELTATERSGLHRYRYPEGREARLVLDLEHRDRVIDAWIRVVDEQEVEGLRRSSSWARDQWVYFVARFSRPMAGAAFDDTGHKVVLSFGDEGGELLVKVGISAVDPAGARANLDAEQPGWDFAAVKRAARAAWNAQLGKITVEGGSDEQTTVFYTALYHTMIAPNLFSDVDGRYRGMDGAIHTAEGRRQYTVFSLWDTFRAAHPLYTLIELERTRDFVHSMLAHHREGGRLPVWELAANETDCMIGYHSVSVIADAWRKGIRGFDGRQALNAMLHSARLPDRGLDAYQRLGYVPADRESESVSKTLEYAYDDWCIARMAEELDQEPIREEFDLRSQAWRHLFDPHTSYLRARENGGWLTPFDPRRVDFHHTEANGWQYRFFVPHDVESVIDRLGGDDAFVARLDSLFGADPQTTGRDQADITGLIGQYAHGNEPSHHVAWLYHYAGRPDRSAHWVRRILDEMYHAAPDGLSGNEDCGQMSAWYVLNSLGLYQVAPGSNQWLLGPPLFPRATIRWEDGDALRIETAGAVGDRSAVVSLERDGALHPRSWISHRELRETRHLSFTLSGTAEEAVESEHTPRWGRAPKDRPVSRVPGEHVVAAPYFEAASRTYRSPFTIRYSVSDPNSRLERWDPESRSWESDAGELFVEEGDREIRIRAVADGRTSPVVSAAFHHIPHAWTVEVSSVPNPQYTAGGNEALVDGLRGPSDWRTGGWQGYQDQDFVAVLDLQESLPLQSVGAGFLQDMRSWIWMPTRLRVWYSADGEHYTALGETGHRVPDDIEGVFTEDLMLDASGVTARYLKFEAANYGTIPAWHPGAGGEAFIFVDELRVELQP